jgi:hypothetical protein
MVRIRDCACKRVAENRGSLLERDPMLLEVPLGLVRIPLKLHGKSLRDAGSTFKDQRHFTRTGGTLAGFSRHFVGELCPPPSPASRCLPH